MSTMMIHARARLERLTHCSITVDAFRGAYPPFCKTSPQQRAVTVLDGATKIKVSTKYDGATVRVQLSVLPDGAKVIRVFYAKSGKELPWVAQQIPYDAFDDVAYILGLCVVCELVFFFRNKRLFPVNDSAGLEYESSMVDDNKWLPLGFVGLPTAMAFSEWVQSHGALCGRISLRLYVFRLQELDGVNGGHMAGGEALHRRILSVLLTDVRHVVVVAEGDVFNIPRCGAVCFHDKYLDIKDTAAFMKGLEETASDELKEGFVVNVLARQPAAGPERIRPSCTKDSMGTPRLNDSVKARCLISIVAVVARCPRFGVPDGVFKLFCRSGEDNQLRECSRLVIHPKKCSRDVIEVLRSMPYSLGQASVEAGAGKRKRGAPNPPQAEAETLAYSPANICVELLCAWMTAPADGVPRPSGIKQIASALRNVPLAKVTHLDEARDKFPYMSSIYCNYKHMLDYIAKTDYKVGKANKKGPKTTRVPFRDDHSHVENRQVEDVDEDITWLQEFMGPAAGAGASKDPIVVEQAVDPAPVEQEVEQAPVEQAVDPAPVEQAVDPAPVEQAVELGLIEEAVEPAPIPVVVAVPVPIVAPVVIVVEEEEVVVPITDPTRMYRFCIIESAHGEFPPKVMSAIDFFQRESRYEGVEQPKEASILVVPTSITPSAERLIHKCLKEGFKVCDLDWILSSVVEEKTLNLEDFPSRHVCRFYIEPRVRALTDVMVFASGVGPVQHQLLKSHVRSLGGTVVFELEEASILVAPAGATREQLWKYRREWLQVVTCDWVRQSAEAGMLLDPSRFLLL